MKAQQALESRVYPTTPPPPHVPGTRQAPSPVPTHTLEDTIHPRTAVQGHTRTLTSCIIILHFSTVLGSGIFAVLGSVAHSANSIRLSLVGTLDSWYFHENIRNSSLALEYDCLLPRFGGG